MKIRNFTLTSSLVALYIFLTIPFVKAQGNQCPGCNIDMTCVSPTNFPSLCPATMPNGTQLQPYDENVTFFMPDKVDASGFSNLDLTQVTITGLSGMPLGLNWTSNTYPSNSYNPTSNVNTQRGCVKICGTPLAAGTYNVIVNVTVTVCDIPIVGCSTLAQSFTLPLTINGAGGGNAFYSYAPATGCDSIDVDFHPTYTTNDPVQMVSYIWDFGNGQTMFTANADTINSIYPNPGQYYPTLYTNIYNLRLKSLSATVTGGWWCGDIEELNCGNGNADLFFTVSGGLGYTSSVIGNTLTPSWPNVNQVLTGTNLTFQFTEDDNGPPFGSQDDNGGATFVNVTGIGSYSGSTIAVSSGGGGVNFSFVIDTVLASQFITTDTVDVFTPPAPPVITATPSAVACDGQNLTLHGPPGYVYEWYENDTTLIVNANDPFYVVPVPGNFPWTGSFRLVIKDSVNNCAASSASFSVTYNESLPVQFGTSGAYQQSSGMLSSLYNGYPSYQWLLNGTPIIPAGQTQNYMPVINGSYSLVITNQYGCSDTSNVVNVFNVGNEEVLNENMISVFPNPNDGHFTINISSSEQKPVRFSLVNMLGETIYSENIQSSGGSWNKYISVESLSPGIYIALVDFERGAVKKKMIIR